MAIQSEAMRNALLHHYSGRSREAAQICRQILATEPEHADALHLLGVIALEDGHLETAIQYIAQAIAADNTSAFYHNNLGEAYRESGRWTDAAACYRQAVERKPDFAEALRNLGIVLAALGEATEAIATLRQALQYKPDYVEAHVNLGIVLSDQGIQDEASACYLRAIELNPAFPQAYYNLGVAAHRQGDIDKALAAYQRAIELKADYCQAFVNSGVILFQQGKWNDAAACYRRALSLEPNSVAANSNLGRVLQTLGAYDEALACYQRVLALQPDSVEAQANLGTLYLDLARYDEALPRLQRAMQLKPQDATLGSNFLYALSYAPDSDRQALREELQRWNQRHAAPLARHSAAHANRRDPERRLRIGYVSPDFNAHPVGRFLQPLLAAHDHAQYEIFCYAAPRISDWVTEGCRAAADCWRDVPHLSDEQLARLIREDGIDILVDLAMHMAHNRLLVFARKPAPVQITYLAYCGTTGLETIDYRLTDPHLDPPGEESPYYTERSIRLRETYWCYQPPDVPPVAPSPASAKGYVTFGCLNNFSKVSPQTLAAWGRLLHDVPGARLLLYAPPGSHRQGTLDALRAAGGTAEQVEFVGRLPLREYFAQYARLDVALDPFPFGGGTTTCDALWMGVPVVSLAGNTAMSRSGVSILSNLGLPELLARDAEHYVQIARELAGDPPRREELRTTLRPRMRQSVLMDAPRFARNVEAAYRSAWRQWCAG